MKNNFYISFGVWIAVLPFLGIPGVWRNDLISVSGLFLILVSLGPTILKKLQTKPKRKKDTISSPTLLFVNRKETEKGGSEVFKAPSSSQGEEVGGEVSDKEVVK